MPQVIRNHISNFLRAISVNLSIKIEGLSILESKRKGIQGFHFINKKNGEKASLQIP